MMLDQYVPAEIVIFHSYVIYFTRGYVSWVNLRYLQKISLIVGEWTKFTTENIKVLKYLTKVDPALGY
jgi:hypothetical protein